MYFRLFLLGNLVLSLGCADDRLSNDSTQSIVDGTWQTPCMENEGGWLQSTYHFSFSSKLVREDIQYSDQCQNALIKSSYEGGYELSVTWADYIHRLEFFVDGSKLTLLDPNFLKETEVCGLKLWPGPEPVDGKDLALDNCPFLLGSSFIYRSLIQVKDDVLGAADPFGAADGPTTEFQEADPSQIFKKLP